MTRYRYELIAFLTGASVMILEIVGARLIAPHFGTSTYVWTAMIGVILASLALGYSFGGKLADKEQSPKVLCGLLSVSALFVLILGVIQAPLLSFIASLNMDLRFGAFFAALFLFGPPSLFIGMVSPHLAKIKVISLETTGQSIGRLEASGALGSIAGTFLTGYFLLGVIGSRAIIALVVVVLILTSFLASKRFWWKQRIVFLMLVLLFSTFFQTNPKGVLADEDSSYARYQVIERVIDEEDVHLLITDPLSVQSGVIKTAPDNLFFAYTKQFYAVANQYTHLQHVLMIGGGTYTVPSAIARTMPNVYIDVVEIDPLLDTLARRFFYFFDSPRLVIHSVDGRTYLHQNTKLYDLVFMDAFTSLSPPFHLTTLQTVLEIKKSLVPNGLVTVNLVGTYEEDNSEYLKAVFATYAKVFKHVRMYQADVTRPLVAVRQNFILLATNSDETLITMMEDQERLPISVKQDGLVLTDDFAPIERLTF